MKSTSKRIVVVLLVLQCVMLAGMLRRDGPFDHVGMDFLTTWVDASMIRDGDAHRLYDTRAQWEYELPVINQYDVHWNDRVMHPYLAPPPLAILGIPFTLLSPMAALAIWMSLAIGAVLLALRKLCSSFAIEWSDIAPLVLGSMPLFALVMLGQADGLLVLAFVVFLAQLRRGREGRAGLALAVLAMKPQLLLAPIIYLLVTGRRRAVVSVAVASAAEAALSFALIGWGGLQDALAVSRRMGGPAGDAVIHVAGMLNIRAAVARSLPTNMEFLQTVVIVVLTALILGVTARIWRRGDSHAVTPIGAGLLCIVTVLTAFHAHYHSGVLALLGVGLLAVGLREHGEAQAAQRLVTLTLITFSFVPFVLFLINESTRRPAALGTIVLLGMWTWMAYRLSLQARPVASLTVLARETSPSSSQPHSEA
ncbi:MAG: DUF2029 domain-containing protein [Thermomicrobiales bacterium]|nr:DUF2029 domain-containing protein [Thermomicrobiales bacterium]